MESLLVAGADTMVGANFAAQLADQYEVFAFCFDKPRALAGCEPLDCEADDPQAVQELLDDLRPQRLVYCGCGANSAWTDAARPTTGDVHLAERWLRAASAVNAAVTLISSDAVFTGPWMFHAEKSQSFCPSPEARTLCETEQKAFEIAPECLVLRTNAFGWSGGWIESLLQQLQTGHTPPLDCVRHASPLLVNDLVDLAQKAWQAGLNGLYHIGGAERTNPAAFTQRLAAEFGLKIPRQPATESLTNRTSGFGQSETSLQTRKIRRALNASVPLLNDGLRKLRQLSLNGFRDRLDATPEFLPPAKVA